MFEQNFAFSLVVVCTHAAISLWFFTFFSFFESVFLLIGFPNPFIVHSSPRNFLSSLAAF